MSGLTIYTGRSARIEAADAYLAARTGSYEYRCHRYDCTIEAMYGLGLDDRSTVIDVGSGWGELGHRLLSIGGECIFLPCRARYIPVDACIDGTDLEAWVPSRRADFFVANEILEHLSADGGKFLISRLIANATKGVIVSTPNPDVVDVLAMDPDHKTPISREWLEARGFHVERACFYGQQDDALFAVRSPEFV